MHIVKNASGKKFLKLSKSDWTEIGQRTGWIKKSQVDLEGLYRQFQGMQPAKSIYVSVYEVERCYGGPEEGGWWYDNYTLKSTKQFFDETEARKFAEALENGIEAKGLNKEPLSSSRGMDAYPDPSDRDPSADPQDPPLGFSALAKNYQVMVEETAGEYVTRGRPHYE
jgi:hypothetical protein